MRIQKALADAGIASRRAAEALVSAGRVTVNGQPAAVGQQVDPARDRLAVDGRSVGTPPAPVYLALAKPAGVTSTVSDRHAARTVVELVPADIRQRAARLYPVGRLDRDSEGLLLLTNDGDWAQRLLHPRHGVEREYAVGLAMPPDAEQRRRLLAGVALEEGRASLDSLRKASQAELDLLATLLGPAAERLSWQTAVVRQGWRRQLRRMFTAVGAPIERLVRLRIGSLHIDGLSLGELRMLSSAEAGRLAGERGTATGGRQDPAAPVTRPRRPLIVSLDGPGSSGKSTVGAAAARQLGYRFCDTGVLYRGLTWLMLERQFDPQDAASIVGLVDQLELAADARGRYVYLLVGGRAVTDLLHTPAVDRHVSQVSRHAEVRAALLPIQRRLASEGGMIMAGRDIGSVVLPHAQLKLYLHVPLEERARRRAKERGQLEDKQALADIEQELRRRDGIDSSRTVAPLRVPDGATVIETEGNTLEQTVEAVVAAIRAAEAGEESGEGRGA